MDLKVRYLGGHRFETSTSHHRLTADQPLELDGSNLGAPPPELFLFSLASCAGYYAADYLNARALPSKDLEIYVSAEKGERPPRFTAIRLDVIAPGLNKHHRDGILRAVESCVISNTLTHPPILEVTVAASYTLELAKV